MLQGVNSKRQTGGVFSLLLLWIVGITLIYYICVMRDLPRVQSLLSSQVISAVAGAGAANASVTLDGRDVILTGSAVSQDEKVAAGYAASGVYGVRHIHNEIQIAPATPAELKSPELSIQIFDDSIILHGLVSSDNSASLIAEGVQQSYPTYTVENNINVEADTSEPDWLENTISSLNVLQLVNKPEVDITDNQIEIRGSVHSVEARDSVFHELGLIYGDALSISNELDVVIPPELIDPELKLVLVNNELTLSGQLHSSEALENIASAVMGAFDLTLMNNELGVDPDVSQALWLDSVLELLPKLNDFQALELGLNGDEAKIAGMVGTDEQRQTALKLIDSTIGTILPVSEAISVEGATDTVDSTAKADTENTSGAAKDTIDEDVSIPGVKPEQAINDSIPDTTADNQTSPAKTSPAREVAASQLETAEQTESASDSGSDTESEIPGDMSKEESIPGGVTTVSEETAEQIVAAVTSETNEIQQDLATETVDSDTETEASARSETTAQTDTSDDSDSTAEADAIADPDTPAEADTSPDSDSTAEADANPDSEATAKADTSSDSDTTAEADTSSDSEATAEADASSDSETTAEADASADSETTAEADASADSETTAEADASPDSDSTAEAGTADESETTAETESSTDADNSIALTSASTDSETTATDADANDIAVEALPVEDEENVETAELEPVADAVTSDADEPATDTESFNTQRTALGAELAALDIINVRFEENKSILTVQSKDILTKVASALAKFPTIGVTINGYTDSVGSYESNLSLSRSRAESVRVFLVSAGIAAIRLEAVGYGESDPIASNDTPAGRALNRRIEFNY